MPTSEEILAQASGIAVRYWPMAVAFHLIVGFVAIAVVRGWRPTNRHAALLALAPIITVAAISAHAGSPVNALMFAALAITLVTTYRTVERGPVVLGPAWTTAAAGASIVFGLIYPHFLPGASLLDYAGSAPVGLLPCPTLALVIGFALLTRGFGSRAWTGILAGAALLYGIYGVVRLGVAIDGALIAGSIALATSRVSIARLRAARI